MICIWTQFYLIKTRSIIKYKFYFLLKVGLFLLICLIWLYLFFQSKISKNAVPWDCFLNFCSFRSKFKMTFWYSAQERCRGRRTSALTSLTKNNNSNYRLWRREEVGGCLILGHLLLENICLRVLYLSEIYFTLLFETEESDIFSERCISDSCILFDLWLSKSFCAGPLKLDSWWLCFPLSTLFIGIL